MPPENEEIQKANAAQDTSAKRQGDASLQADQPANSTTSKSLYDSAYNQNPTKGLELNPKEPSNSSALEDLGRSFAYSMLQAPVDAVTQIIDRQFDTETCNALHVLDAPDQAEFGTMRWTAQQVGSTAGSIVPFLLIHKGVKSALGSPTEITARSLPLSTQASLRMRDLAITGGIYGTVFTPVESSYSPTFWQDRFKNGAISSLTFATMAGTGIGVQQLGQRLGSRALSSSIAANTLAGLPAGLVHADATALLKENRFATGQERTQSAVTFAATGALFAFGEGKLDRLTSPKPKTPEVVSLIGMGEKPGGIQITDLVAKINAAKGNGTAALDLRVGDNVTTPKELVVTGKTDAITGAGTSPSKYISDVTAADGTRTLIKSDGVKVTISGGKASVEYPPGHPKLAAKDVGAAEAQPGDKASRPTRQKSPDYSHLPIEERPVNVGSKSADATEAQMSNFEHAPFVLDGRQFASVEGFYVWLKWSGDPAKQAIAQTLSGSQAKSFGKPSTATTAEYNGATIQLGSPEHHALIKRAIQAKLEHHPEIARNFVATYPRPIIHDLGYPENPATRLPAKDFSRILTELREDLATGKIVTKDGAVTLPENKIAETTNTMQTASDALRSLSSEPYARSHPIERYAKAFEGFDRKVKGPIGGGGDSVALELVDGNVLKITNRRLDNVVGTRWFDLPMLEKGTRDAGGGLNLHYFVQPKAITPVPEAMVTQFKADLAASGYRITDGGSNQLGLYEGKVKLLDPFAVTKD